MGKVDRFTVSLDTELLAAFDRHLAQRGYENRSEAVRDLIREVLISARPSGGNETVTTLLTMCCDHRQRSVADRIRTCLAGQPDLIVGSFRVPVDAHLEALAVALRGPSERVVAVANELQALRGVSLGRSLTLSASEQVE